MKTPDIPALVPLVLSLAVIGTALGCAQAADMADRTLDTVERTADVKERLEGDEEEAPASAGEQSSGSATAGAAGAAGVSSNYDFEAGDRVLFQTDFSRDNAGDFPRDLEFVSGNWDVVEIGGRRMLRDTGDKGSAINIPLGERLPERFTIELDVLYTIGHQAMVLTTAPPESHWESLETGVFNIQPEAGIVVPQGGLEATTGIADAFLEGPVRIRIMVDGSHAKMYVGRTRVANVPGVELARGDRIQITNSYFSDAENPMYIGAIRVAAGGRDLYDALESEGRVVTRGIHFDSGSDRLRSESTASLREIATMLREHPDLDLVIEGHTDDVGEAEANRELSRRRAEAVRRTLVEEFGVAGSRLEARGLGETRPVADNDTAEGRQQNRRVELVRRGS